MWQNRTRMGRQWSFIVVKLGFLKMWSTYFNSRRFDKSKIHVGIHTTAIKKSLGVIE